MAVIPPTGFGVTKSQIAAWQACPPGDLYREIQLIIGECDYARLDGAEPYDGYLLPGGGVTDTSYIAGWLQGRRSAGLHEWPMAKRRS